MGPALLRPEELKEGTGPILHGPLDEMELMSRSHRRCTSVGLKTQKGCILCLRSWPSAGGWESTLPNSKQTW